MSVIPFPAVNWRDIPGLSREFADKVEAGQYGEITRALLVLDTPDGVHTLSWGEGACPIYIMGLCQAAANTVYAEGLMDD